MKKLAASILHAHNGAFSASHAQQRGTVAGSKRPLSSLISRTASLSLRTDNECKPEAFATADKARAALRIKQLTPSVGAAIMILSCSCGLSHWNFSPSPPPKHLDLVKLYAIGRASSLASASLAVAKHSLAAAVLFVVASATEMAWRMYVVGLPSKAENSRKQ